MPVSQNDCGIDRQAEIVLTADMDLDNIGLLTGRKQKNMLVIPV